jgi:regulator of sigma E protease
VTTIISFIFVIGVLIFVHELGHFLVARLHGVRVVRFSLGFDPKLVSFERGGTLYSVGVIPLGGFVKLAGETVDDQRTGAPDEFLSKSKWVRCQVYLAGPAMNVLLAVVLLAVTFSRGADVPRYQSEPPIVGTVAAGSPAEKAGLQPGDRIVSVDGRAVNTWNDLDAAVVPNAGRELQVVADQRGQQISVRVTPESVSRLEFGNLGVAPVMRPQIATVEPGGPADRAGLRHGDVILTIAGARLDREGIIDRIRKSADVPLRLSIERDGVARDVTVVPAKSEGAGVVRVSLSEFEMQRVQPTVLGAARMSVQRNWESTVLIWQTLGGLFSGRTPVRRLMGPVMIAQLSGSAAEIGWTALFELMAMISLNLGLINLLPVPVMDGGQVAILGFEGLVRHDLSRQVKERILLAGVALIALLMVTVIYNDVVRLMQ